MRKLETGLLTRDGRNEIDTKALAKAILSTHLR